MRKALVVEDDGDIVELVSLYLAKDGWDVESVADGKRALERVRRGAYQLIILDIQLPGMDGLELTRRLKANPATEPIPIVAMTGQTMPIHQRAAMAAGCAGFISKPATPAALASEVRTHIKGQGQGS